MDGFSLCHVAADPVSVLPLASLAVAVSVVVLPAYIEHQPRRLLECIARGVPVIATTACGLEMTKGVINIPPGDVQALRHEIEKLVSNARR